MAERKLLIVEIDARSETQFREVRLASLAIHELPSAAELGRMAFDDISKRIGQQICPSQVEYMEVGQAILDALTKRTEPRGGS